MGSMAHMGQGPHGPRALPCWANTSPKNAPWKKESKLCFFVVFGKQKRCGTSVRSFSTKFRAEISAMCQKTKVSVFEKRFNFVRTLVHRRQIAQWAGTRTTHPGGTGFETGVRDRYLPKTRECVPPFPQGLFLPPKTRPRVFP